jgi:L-2-hydroxyglutarate oxidase LhgO
MERTVDCVVVGAGVVGLAVTRALAKKGLKPLLLERHPDIGRETSSHNSFIVHSGVLYAPGSVKARVCVAGRKLLYAFCAEHGVTTKQIGKLFIAIDYADLARLATYRAWADGNGITEVEMISGDDASKLEPNLRCLQAMHSHCSGIVDGPAFMRALRKDGEAAGAEVGCGAPVLGGEVTGAGFTLELGGREPMTVKTRYLVNSAGMHAPAFAQSLRGLAPATIPNPRVCKGSYFTIAGPAPFRHAIYPMRNPASGTGGGEGECTPHLDGTVAWGPDIQWVDWIEYGVDPSRSSFFYDAIRRYWPALPDGALKPAYAGIRPKVTGPGEPNHDLVIQFDDVHGLPGLVNLYGIESPGLTGSMAIGDIVTNKLCG